MICLVRCLVFGWRGQDSSSGLGQGHLGGQDSQSGLGQGHLRSQDS